MFLRNTLPLSLAQNQCINGTMEQKLSKFNPHYASNKFPAPLEPGSSVAMVARLRTEWQTNHDLISGRIKLFFSSRKGPDRLRGLPSL